MNHRAIYDALAAELDARLGVRVRFKNESLLMRVLGAILFFNPAFMTGYITTIGRTVYFPDRSSVEGDRPDWATLAHEGVHVADYVARPVRFVGAYLFPQWLAVGALVAIGAVWSLWFLCALAFLAALAPWPAPGRARLERRGYQMTIVCTALEYGLARVRSPEFQEWMTDIYTGPDYYWMDRDRARVRSRVAADVSRAERLLEGVETDEIITPTIALVRSQ